MKMQALSLAIVSILTLSVNCIAQISGPTSVTLNNTYNYSYYSPSILAGASWFPSGGTVISQWEAGSEGSGFYYYADIKWTSTGEKTLMFANFSEPMSTIDVDVCSSGQAAGVSLPGTVSICAGSTVQFNATPTNGGGSPSYVWKVNGVAKQTGGSSTYSTNQLELNDVISVTMTSSITCLSPRTATASSTVTSVTQPTAVSVSVNDPGPMCSGTSVNFTASVTHGGTSPTYTWYRNGNIVDDNEISGNTGTYDPYSTLQNGETIKCYVTSNATCISGNASVWSNTVTISIQSPTAPSVSISVQNQTMCEGDPVTFTASSSQTITSYSWSIGGSVQLGSDPTFSPSGEFALHAPGETINLTVGVSGSCLTQNSASDSHYQTVYTPSSIGTLSVNSMDFCSSGTVSFTVASNVGTLSWKMRYRDGSGAWTNWDFFSPSSNSYPVMSGVGITRWYQFQAFATSGTCAPAESNIVDVYAYPTSALGTLHVNQSEFCSPGQGQLTLSSFTGDLTWQYRYKDGSAGFGSWTTFSTEETTSLNTPVLNSGSGIERIYEIQVQAKSGTCSATPWSVETVTVYPVSSVEGFAVSPGTEFNGSQTPSLTLSHVSAVGSVIYESSISGTGWSGTPTTLSVNQTTQFRATATSGTCPPYSSQPITVFLYPVPVISVEDGTTYLSYGNTIKLSTGSYYSYQWRLNNVDIVGAIQRDHVADKAGVYTVRVKGSSVAPEAASEALTIYDAVPSQDMNYISVVTFLKEMTDPGALSGIRPDYYSQTTTYYDGLGRPMQNVVTKGSPQGKDVVQPIVYDDFGREPVKYLPYVSDQVTGHYKEDALSDPQTLETDPVLKYKSGEQYDFYQVAIKIEHDEFPYSKTMFESSPLNRLLEQGAPGSPWQPGNGNTIRKAYTTNGPVEVLRWIYMDPTDDHPLGLVNAEGHYTENKLFKNITIDENDKEVIEYVDKEGKTVLKRVQAVESPSATDDTNYASTYYIYDDFGQLVCVVPPEATKRLLTEYYHSTADNTSKESFLSRWAFRYRYDGRKRMVMKQVPGADSVTMVYDKRDRLVLTQDGNQRNVNKWSFTKYDELNRPIMTGIYTHGSQVDQKDMSGLLSTTTISEIYDGNPANDGYSNNVFPTSNIEILTVTYYDNYDFKTLISDPNGEFNFRSDEIAASGGLKGQDQEYVDRLKNLVTGTLIKVLNSGTPLWSVNYYDDHYRVIQSTTSNHKDGYNRVTNVYDFVGKVLRTKTRYTIPGHLNHADTKIFQRYSYDHAGRLLNTWHQIEGGPEVVISSNEYNELGQLVTKKHHQATFDETEVTADPLADQDGTSYDTDIICSSYSGSQSVYVASNSIRLLPGFAVAAGSTFTARIGYSQEDALAYNNAIGGEFLQTIDYRYNIRGWLKLINDPSSPISDDLFNMELSYNTPTANGGEAQFNGNISEAVWKSAGLDKQSYGYDYDPMNRITKGSYYNLAKAARNGWYNEKIGDETLPAGDPNRKPYDLNGNILSLVRNGKTDAGTYGLMDKLRYDYGTTGGNQLMFVSDAQATGGQEEGFKEIVEGTTDYTYDENGNLTKDENKGITGDAATQLKGIEYNHLNLPARVSKSSTEYIVYTYDATGRKLAQQVFGAEAKTTDYLGELVFEDNALQFILHGEGRVVADTEPGALDPWEYQYFLKDHLGNTRVVFSEKKNSEEYKATFEDDRQSEEMANFLHYPSSRSPVNEFDHTDAGTVHTKSQLLHGGDNNQVGLAKSFAVNPGDVFDLEVYAKYLAPSATATNLSALFSGIVSAFSLGSATSPLDGADAYSAMENVFQGGGPWINSSMWDDAAPKAYLNYLLFDENFVLIDFGFDQISIECQQDSDLDPVALHDYLSLHVKVEQKGYLYVYLSNEEPTSTNVYFDDMKIVHYSAVEQVGDYYPFGLTFNSYQRANSLDQEYLYTGKELQDELELGWYDFGARMYMADIGRWGVTDPLAEKYYSISPYTFVANNPILFVDPDGQEIWITYGDNQRVKYENGRLYNEDGSKYKGKDEFVSSAYKTLNGMNSTKNGKSVLGELSASENKFTFTNTYEKDSKGNDVKGTLSFAENKDGGGVIHAAELMNKETGFGQKIENTAHELYHGYQHENGQGGASVNNEVESYLFGRSVAIQSRQAYDFSFGNRSPMGQEYDQAMFNLITSPKFDPKSFQSAIMTFKTGSRANSSGIYNQYPYKLKKPLISRFYPLIE